MELSFFALVLIVIICFFFYSSIKKVRALVNKLLDKANEAVDNWEVDADED